MEKKRNESKITTHFAPPVIPDPIGNLSVCTDSDVGTVASTISSKDPRAPLRGPKDDSKRLLSRKKVAIIGGGITGLITAYLLAEKGFDVSLYEKEGQLGGILSTTRIGDTPIERFYHHFFKGDKYLIDLISELGLSDRVLWPSSSTAFCINNKFFPYNKKSDFFHLPFLSYKARAQAIPAAIKLLFQKSDKISNNLTAENFIIATFGQETWQKIWQPMFLKKFGPKYYRDISAKWFLSRLKVRSTSSKNGQEVLGYLDGSFQTLIDKLVSDIKKNDGKIYLGYEVGNIYQGKLSKLFNVIARSAVSDNCVPRSSEGAKWEAIPTTTRSRIPILEQFQYGASPAPERCRASESGMTNIGKIDQNSYDIVISTIAPPLVSKLMPKLQVPPVDYLGAITALFTLKKNPSRFYWHNNLDPNLPFSVLVNQHALLPGYYRNFYPFYVGQYLETSNPLFAQSDQSIADYYIGQLKLIFPSIPKDIIEYQISKSAYAQPIIPTGWQALKRTTNLPNLYMTSMAHVFPEDRGVNYAIREAYEIVNLINN